MLVSLTLSCSDDKHNPTEVPNNDNASQEIKSSSSATQENESIIRSLKGIVYSFWKK